ncbi:MAG: PAS domain S-box protein [Phycisphaerae bacterium]|nr:PAS domain S-box protein [Phycisphaerae bacterium]NIP55050.1 PAS domain S-box protein [Phycisphaerae bacterium]NIS53760.1 PAS domain S-box protein [Phycisphaerae bacterium]NIU11338.1 PAS domain S-box protein [Phycisphaerae bacterium]NIU57468.1 PAS domain S-box protein [Phycisphaerae bacterium]
MGDKSRKTGIDIIGDVPWGTHFCQFYQTKKDLIDILVPYFKAGLENNEFCMWITSEPLNSKEAKRALKKKVKNLDDRIEKGQIEILDYTQWYTKTGRFDADEVLQGWIEKEKQALEAGFEGLRLSGNTFWLDQNNWKRFTDYEAAVNSVIGQHRMLAICTYSLERCTPSEIIDVVSNHEFVLIRRAGKWEIIESIELKKMAEARRQSEEEFRLAFENAVDAIFWADPETGLITNCNKAAETLLEKKRKDIIGQHQRTVHPLEKSEYYLHLFKKHADRKEVSNDYAEVITKSGKIKPVNITASLTMVGGKPVIQRIFHDITKFEQIEEALRESQRQLSTRNSIAEIFLTIPDDEIYGAVLNVLLEAMESKYGIFGYIDEQEKLIIPSMTRDIWEKCQVPDKTIVYPREKWGGIWGRALKEKKSLYANEGLHVPEGHVPITRVLVVPIIYGGQVIGLLEVANKSTDYSHKDQEFLESIAGKIAPILNARLQRDREERDRKQAEEALRESENKHRTLLKNIPQKIFYKDLNSVYVLCNESYAEDLNIKPPEIEGKTDYDFYPKDLADKYISDDKRIMQSGKTVSLEERYVKNGKEGTVNTFKAPVKDEKGNVIGLFGIFWDITERKQMEETLERSEERYALAQRAANIGSWDWDITTGNLVWSEQIEPMFGFGRGEFGATYEAFLECVHPEDLQHVVGSVNTCVETGKDYAIEHRIIWPDGTIRWMSETGGVVRNKSGKAIRMVGIVRDITDRKERESQQHLVEMVLKRLNQKEQLPELIHDVAKLIKEYTGFEAVGVRLHEGEDFPYFTANGFSEDFIEDENYLCARNKDGEQILDEEGCPILSCMCGSVIVGHADPALPFFTETGSFWTNSTTELQNSASLDTIQVPLRNRCNEAGYESVALIPLRSGDEIVGLLQLNDSRPGRFTLEMVRFLEGIGASIGIGMARIKAEENIHNLAKFPSENPNPVLRIAKEGIVLYSNAAGSELLKTWGCNIGEKVPEHWNQYVLRILKSGSNEELEVSCGDRVFSLIFAPVVEAGYVNIYGVDITERKLAEEDLRKYRQHLEELVDTRTGELTQANRQLLREIETRKGLEKEILNVSELERRKIGQELHDSLGQQLTGVAFMTKVLEQKLAKKSLDEAADVAQIAQLVNQATNQARSLAKGLHPIDLDTGTLVSSLQDLAESTKTLFGINCSFKCDKHIRIDNPEVAVHLYRIAQEAITNAIKHGKAKNIQIYLAYNVNKSILTVINDGIDFPKEFEARNTGMGLQIMDHRVDIIEGSLNIHKGPKGGTIMTCTFPVERQQ